MIRIEIDRDELTLIAEGHAGSAQAGQDLVCCAVTTLVLGLVSACDVANERIPDSLSDDSVIEIESGKAEIRLKPEQGRWDFYKTVFNAYADALTCLGRQYGEYIEIKAQGA